MRFFRRRFSKSFWNFFFSYVLILCIPTIILVFFCYTNFIGRFQTMTYESHLLHQQNKSESMDMLLDELKNISIQFSARNLRLDNLEEDVVARMDLMQQLQGLLSLNTSLQDVVFWMPEQELFYSTKSSFSQQSYGQIYDAALVDTLLSEWRLRQTVHTLTCRLFAGGGTESNVLYFSCPYPYASTMPTGYLVFCLDLRKFLPITGDPFTLQYGGQALIDEIGQSGADDHPPIDMRDPKKTFITTESPSNGLTLTTAIDNHVLFASLMRTRNMFLLCNVLVFLACLFILSFFSRKNAKPINDLNHMLVKLGVISEEAMLRTTETSRTIAYMEELAEANQQLDQRLLEEQYTSRSLWLSKLLNGHEQYLPDLLPHLKKYGIELSSAFYTVALIYVDTEVQSNRYFDAYLFQREPFELYYHVDAQNKIYLLIGSPGAGPAPVNALAGEIVQKFAGIDIRSEVFLGATYQGVEAIHRAYTSALATVHDEITFSGKVHAWSERPATHAFFYPRVELDSLQNALCEKDAEQFRAVIESISAQMEHSIYRDFWYKTVCYEIVNLIIRNLVTEENRQWLLEHINQFLFDLSRTASRQEIIDRLRRFSGALYDQLIQAHPAENRRRPRTMDEIVAFITENYTDPDFFLGKIAAEFGMTQNNLSQQLKRTLGMSPAKYVSALRIHDAKELLAHSDLSIREIGLRVGFSDPSTFNRNFRAFTSMTPNQYRAINRDEAVG